MSKARRVKAATTALPLKLDLGCGPNKRAGYEGVDRLAFPGVDHVLDLAVTPWPWADGSVGEAHCSHTLEHLTAVQRIGFVNELHRVLVPGGTVALIVPHWASCRAYGDPTHQWPPVSEFWFYYLKREWRMANAPHTDQAHWAEGFTCDFDSTWGYALHDSLINRNDEYRQFALSNYKEAAMDLIATLVKPAGKTA